jgi:hypothetical protein
MPGPLSCSIRGHAPRSTAYDVLGGSTEQDLDAARDDLTGNEVHGALCKTGCECRPSGPARAVGAGSTGSNLSVFLPNANFCIRHMVRSPSTMKKKSINSGSYGTSRSRLPTHLSGRGDLNSCSLDPQSSALTKLGHVPSRRDIALVALARQTSAGSVSLAQLRRGSKRTRPEPPRRGHRAAAGGCVIRAGPESYDVPGMALLPCSLVVAKAMPPHPHRRSWPVASTRDPELSLPRRRLR